MDKTISSTTTGALMKRLPELTAEERGTLMSRVRNQDTSLELLLRRALWAQGLRYLTYRGWVASKGEPLIGKPDVIFPKRKVAVFIDGCYWHGCPLGCKGTPKTNTEFWHAKVEKNRRRDTEVSQALADQDWIVLRFWQHQLNRKSGLATAVEQVAAAVRRTAQGAPHAYPLADSGA